MSPNDRVLPKNLPPIPKEGKGLTCRTYANGTMACYNITKTNYGHNINVVSLNRDSVEDVRKYKPDEER